VERVVSDRLRADPAQPRALTPEVGRWSASRITAAHRYYLSKGVPENQLRLEFSADPGAALLWHSVDGPSASIEEQQVLARTWVEAGELRYEGPEVTPDQQPPATRWDNGATADDLAADLQAMADRNLPPFARDGDLIVSDHGWYRLGEVPHSAAVKAFGGDFTVGSHGYRPGDRVSGGDHEYVVTAVDGNSIGLSPPPRAWRSVSVGHTAPAGGMRSPAAKSQPPVPRWAKKKRTRAAARGGR
jgi:hypothetical protein